MLFSFQYVGTVLKLFPTAEGYVSNTVAAGTNNYRYVFNYLDHLGNVRLSYSQDTKGRQIVILEESHYYPYGLKHANYNPDILAFMEEGEGGEGDVILVPVESADANKYKFNGKEWQDELGLNMTAMDFRQYDNAIGRFISIDALSEINYSQSPYHFANNNPVYFSDPTGLDDIIIDMNTVQSGTTINFLYTQSDVDNAVGDLYLGNEEGGLTYIENSLGMVTVQAGGASWRTHANLTIQSHVYSKSRFYEGFRDRQFSGQIDNMQSVLDAIGTIDPTGIVDGVNALGYLARGQKANAAIAAIGIIPYIGDAAKAKKAYSVYHGLNASGAVKYVGITSRNPAVRWAEHQASGGGKTMLDYEAIEGAVNLSKQQARVLEQTIINTHGLEKNGGQLLNQINSIAPKNWSKYGINP